MALCEQWLVYGKVNSKQPDDYDENNKNQIMYDEAGKFGSPIIGGIKNGYDEQQLKTFWKSLEGYANYLFNLSHSACYSYLTILTAYLKTYHPVEFMASLLSSADEKKTDKYVRAAESMGIQVTSPDINLSSDIFMPVDGKILYGLSSIKGLGDSSLPEILNNKPYSSIENLMEILPKKVFNKRVGVALIKSGALDRFDNNRYTLINQFYDLRKDKDDRYDTNKYNEDVCILFEKEVLGASVTYKPWWDGVENDEKIKNIEMEIISVQEKNDKNGNLMGFINLKKGSEEIRGVMFSSSYCKCAGTINNNINKTITVNGKKDSKGGLIINSISEIKKPIDDTVLLFEKLF